MRACRGMLLVALWVAVAFLPSGCKRFSVIAPVPPASLSHSKYTLKNYDDDLTVYTKDITSGTAADKAQAQVFRDKIVYGLMAEIDDAFGQFTKNLFAGKGLVGVGGDSTQLGLTAAAAIATHTPTKTILSALATALTGVNLSVDKNFFAQQTYQAIAVAMQTRRDKARIALITSLGGDVDKYPLEAARRDLVSYFYAGTLPGGLEELQQEAGAAASKIESPKAPLH